MNKEEKPIHPQPNKVKDVDFLATRLKIIYPMHPRTRKMLAKFGIDVPPWLNAIEPVGFIEFLQLEANAKVVLTDSGGVQEECCILKVPCVTLRDNTERPETVEVGANVLVGTNPEKIVEGVKKMINARRNWENPFGNGTAGKKIVFIIQNRGKIK